MGNTVANIRLLNKAVALMDRDGLTDQEAADAVGIKVEVLTDYLETCKLYEKHHDL